MEININNYEIVLVDYFDGKLNALEVAEVLLFLEQHPNIKKEFEAFGTMPKSFEASLSADFKAQLKKHTHLQSFSNKTFDELLVAQIEGEFNNIENDALNSIIISNDSLNSKKKVFALTKLVPDINLTYPHKKDLKRKEAVIFYLNKRFAAAAAILLISAMLFLVYKNSGNSFQSAPIANNNSNKNSNLVKQKVGPQNQSKIDDVNLAQSSNIVKADNTASYFKVNQKNGNANQKNIPIQLKAIFSAENQEKISLALAPMPIKKIENQPIQNELKNLNINDEINLVESITSFGFNYEEEKFLTLGNWIKKKFIERSKNNLIENEKPLQEEELVIDPMTVASVGAGILEKTTGKKVSLSRSYNKGGSVKSYTFAAGNFKYERIK